MDSRYKASQKAHSRASILCFLPMPITYTTYPAPTRSHHSTRAKRSLSRSYRSPSHYGGSEHGQGYRHSGTYAGSTHSHGSGLGRVYAYDTGHHRSGSHGYPQNYYHASSTRPHSRSLTKTHYDPRGYATTSHQPEYFVSDDAGMSNQAGYYTSVSLEHLDS